VGDLTATFSLRGDSRLQNAAAAAAAAHLEAARPPMYNSTGLNDGGLSELALCSRSPNSEKGTFILDEESASACR
jgi:hypothetical protein